MKIYLSKNKLEKIPGSIETETQMHEQKIQNDFHIIDQAIENAFKKVFNKLDMQNDDVQNDDVQNDDVQNDDVQKNNKCRNDRLRAMIEQARREEAYIMSVIASRNIHPSARIPLTVPNTTVNLSTFYGEEEEINSYFTLFR
jgi:hypothetical protein